jgi:hypothetical protein
MTNTVKLGYNKPAKVVHNNREFVVSEYGFGAEKKVGKCVCYNLQFIKTEFVITECDCK